MINGGKEESRKVTLKESDGLGGVGGLGTAGKWFFVFVGGEGDGGSRGEE